MSAAKLDIYIEQGATFTLGLVWKDANSDPIDLTGYVARMQLRSNISSEEVEMEITSTDGEITLGGAAGTISIWAPPAKTSLITSKKGVYDLELEAPNGDVFRVIQGSAQISPEVTR